MKAENHMECTQLVRHRLITCEIEFGHPCARSAVVRTTPSYFSTRTVPVTVGPVNRLKQVEYIVRSTRTACVRSPRIRNKGVGQLHYAPTTV